jgi:NTP-dependent ternary system trypsin peptidase co-occuring protein
MSSQTVTYAVDGDTPVVFEIEPVPGFVPAAAPGELVGRVRNAMGPIVEAAKEVLSQARSAGLDEVEVTFGVKVTGTMTWVVAKAATEGNFEVTLKWRRTPTRG